MPAMNVYVALVELGWQIRNDSQFLGFNQTFLVGYSNNYLMYFATPNEYLVGGYEATLTLWGIDTAERIRASCFHVAKQVRPLKSIGGATHDDDIEMPQRNRPIAVYEPEPKYTNRIRVQKPKRISVPTRP